MMSSPQTAQRSGNDGFGDSSRLMLWIDGVGSYLVCLGDEVRVGGPAHLGSAAWGTPSPPIPLPGGEGRQDRSGADVALLANLSRRHATIRRGREAYWLSAHAATSVAGHPVNGSTHLSNDCEIEFASGVRLRFRVPTPLSMTATLEFLSDHRPSLSVDGVVLMAETCLLGPGRENHVRCPRWPETVLLFRKNGAFWCRPLSELSVNGRPLPEGGPLSPGDVVSGDEFRFRLEAVE